MKHDSKISATTLIPKRFFYLLTVFLTFFWIGCLLGSNSHVVAATAENDSMETEAKVFEEPVTYDINSLNLENSEIGEVQDGGSTGNNLFDFEAFIKNSDIVDGSAPFDDNDEAGNDSSEKNGIVRTFDTVTYPIKITINPKKVDKLENIILKITGTLENGVTDNRINAKFSVGGYENLETAEVGFEQTYTISQTGTSVMIPVSYEVQGAKNGVDLKPNIQVQVVSVDGEDITGDRIVQEFNNLPSVKTSGKVNIKGYINPDIYGSNYYITYPMKRVLNDTKDISNLGGFSVSFGVEKLPEKPDVRGSTFPSGEIKYRLDFDGWVYWDGGPKAGSVESLNFENKDSPLILFDHHPINFSTNMVGMKNTYMSGKSYIFPDPLGYNTGRSKRGGGSYDEWNDPHSVWDSGNWGVESPHVTKEKVSYKGTNEGYIIGSTFPVYRADGWKGGYRFGVDEKVFSTNGFIAKLPNEYLIGGKNNPDGYGNNVYYRYSVTIEHYVDDNGKDVEVNKTYEMTDVERNVPEGSAHVQTTLAAHPSGSQLGTPMVGNPAVSRADASTILGEDVKIVMYARSSMIYYGGIDVLYKWNIDSFELTEEYAEKAENSLMQYYNGNGQYVANDTETQKLMYGIQKFTDNSFESFMYKGKESYDWYVTYQEAMKHGTVGAILNIIEAPTMGGTITGVHEIPLKVKTRKIGSSNEYDTTNVTAVDLYIYPKADRSMEIDVYGNHKFGNPTIWNESGEMIKPQTPVGESVNFQSLGILNAETASDIQSDKATYYNSETIDWNIKSSIILPLSGAPDDYDGSVEVKQILPRGLDYKVGSGKQGEIKKEPRVVRNQDGTTTLVWDLLLSKDRTLDDVTYSTTINPFALTSGVQSNLTVKNIISSPLDTRNEALRTSSKTVTILKVGMVGIYSNVDALYGDKNSQYRMTLQPYTTIEEEYDVKGLTMIPLSLDDLGSVYEGSAVLDNIQIVGDKPVTIYLNNSVVKSDKPNEVDINNNGWYKYIGGNQDISRAVSLLFHVEGVLENTDNIEINYSIKTKDNNFGNMYMNETVINSATDYKLSPVSNKVKYTIRADAELNFERIQIYTANAKTNLPVKLRINKEIFRERALGEPLKLVIYEKDTNQKVYEKPFTIGNLPRENDLEIPSQYLEKNTGNSYEVRVEGYNTDRIYVKEEADKIDTLGYTASEKLIEQQAENNSKLEYEGVVMTEREVGKEIESYYETITLPIKKIGSVKSGYGFELDQKMQYTNDLAINNSLIPTMKVTLDRDVVDGDLYTNVDNMVTIELIEDGSLVDDKLVRTYKYPNVFVLSGEGTIISEQQYFEMNSNPSIDIVEGGNKVYVPIWIKQLGSYNYAFGNTEPMGVNEVRVNVMDTVDVKAYMFGHIGSETIKDDEILIVPVDLQNPFPEGLPEGWTSSDVEWLQGN